MSQPFAILPPELDEKRKELEERSKKLHAKRQSILDASERIKLEEDETKMKRLRDDAHVRKLEYNNLARQYKTDQSKPSQPMTKVIN